jgi:hypothetical protein
MLKYLEVTAAGHMIQLPNNAVFNLEGVETVYVSKPFFKKYNFKIVYDFSTKPIAAGGVAYAGMQTRISSRNIANNAAMAIAAYLPNLDFKHRIESGRLSMFVQSYGDFLLVSKVHPDKIKSVAMPLNEKQVEMMDEHGAATVFKHKLFHNAYRYKVSLYATEDVITLIPAINNVNIQLGDGNFLASKNYNRVLGKLRVSFWNMISMYYNDPQDIMMVRFVLGKVPHKIEKCVLYDEIS